MKKGSKRAAELGHFTIILRILSDEPLRSTSDKPPSFSESEFLLCWGSELPCPLSSYGNSLRRPGRQGSSLRGPVPVAGGTLCPKGRQQAVHIPEVFTSVSAPPGSFLCVCYWLSPVRLFATPPPVAHQASLSTEVSRQEYWSGLPFPSPEGSFLNSNNQSAH